MGLKLDLVRGLSGISHPVQQNTLTDLGVGGPCASPYFRPKCSRAHAILGKIWNHLENPGSTHWRIQGGGARDARPPGSKFFHFHAVFGKKLKNNSTFGSWCTPLGKILDPPLLPLQCIWFLYLKRTHRTHETHISNFYLGFF